jgi:hypothetical protein
MRTRDIKARAEELLEGYDEARAEAFYEEFEDMFVVNGALAPINEDDVQGFIDSFTFPDEDEWAYDQVENEIADIEDQRYQQMKDERYE